MPERRGAQSNPPLLGEVGGAIKGLSNERLTHVQVDRGKWVPGRCRKDLFDPITHRANSVAFPDTMCESFRDCRQAS